MNDTDDKPSEGAVPVTASPTPDPAPTDQPLTESTEVKSETATDETAAQPAPEPDGVSSIESKGDEQPSNGT